MGVAMQATLTVISLKSKTVDSALPKIRQILKDTGVDVLSQSKLDGNSLSKSGTRFWGTETKSIKAKALTVEANGIEDLRTVLRRLTFKELGVDPLKHGTGGIYICMMPVPKSAKNARRQ